MKAAIFALAAAILVLAAAQPRYAITKVSDTQWTREDRLTHKLWYCEDSQCWEVTLNRSYHGN